MVKKVPEDLIFCCLAKKSFLLAFYYALRFVNSVRERIIRQMNCKQQQIEETPLPHTILQNLIIHEEEIPS